jgi:hypothetical protein
VTPPSVDPVLLEKYQAEDIIRRLWEADEVISSLPVSEFLASNDMKRALFAKLLDRGMSAFESLQEQ